MDDKEHRSRAGDTGTAGRYGADGEGFALYRKSIAGLHL